jgi:hypothetical protein
LQGFLNFCGKEEKLRTVQMKKLNKMIEMFKADWGQALELFYKNCGYNSSIPDNCSVNALISDLELLKTDNKHCGAKTTIIGSYNDEIVPKRIIEDNFSGLNNVSIMYVNEPRHILGYAMEKEVASVIKLIAKPLHNIPNKHLW